MLVKSRELRGENSVWSINSFLAPVHVKILLHHIPNENIACDHIDTEFQGKCLQQ